MMSEKKKKKVFMNGPIAPEIIAKSISNHSSKTTIGAHQLFLGQVRNDELKNSRVIAIEYTAYEGMAEDKLTEIREEAFEKFNITCMHIYHSLGKVNAGELCFFVFVSSSHRKDSREACAYLVDRIKAEVPIYGKEILESGIESWKINSND